MLPQRVMSSFLLGLLLLVLMVARSFHCQERNDITSNESNSLIEGLTSSNPMSTVSKYLFFTIMIRIVYGYKSWLVGFIKGGDNY